MSWENILKNFNWEDNERFVEKYLVLKKAAYAEARGTPLAPHIFHAFELIEKVLDKSENEHDLYDTGVEYIVMKVGMLDIPGWNAITVKKLFSGLF